MESKAIAGLIGPVTAALGAALVINRDLGPDFADELSRGYLLVIIAGALVFLAGLAIVRVHNVWRGWPALVTLLGWLAMLGGLMRMWFPSQLAKIAEPMLSQPLVMPVSGVVLLLLGAFLCFQGYRKAA